MALIDTFLIFKTACPTRISLGKELLISRRILYLHCDLNSAKHRSHLNLFTEEWVNSCAACFAINPKQNANKSPLTSLLYLI